MSLSRLSLMLVASLLGSVAAAVPARAQFPHLVTDVEETYPPGSLFIAEIVFRDPAFSPSTIGIVAGATNNGTYLTNSAQGSFGLVHSGSQSISSFWAWQAAADHTAWVRLTTNNTQYFPNPALHLGGKVRFWLAAQAYSSLSFATPVSGGQLKLGLGVRETGVSVAQGQNGGTTGDIEWVGLSSKLWELLASTNLTCDTTAMMGSDDVQLVPAGTIVSAAHIACVSAGPDGIMQTTQAGDDISRITPVGLQSVPMDGVYHLYEFDLPALQAAGSVFGFTGDGMLGAMPVNRGTLEHLVLTNVPSNADANANAMLIFIDDITFESPTLDPPRIKTQPTPPQPGDTHVDVELIHPSATLVEVLRLVPGGTDVVIGSVNPAGASSVSVPTSILATGISIVAQQRIGTAISDYSEAVAINVQGNGPVRMAIAVRETDPFDHNLPCGGDGTGFDPDAPSTIEFIGATGTSGFGVPNGRHVAPQTGWQEITWNACTDGVTAFSGNGVLNLNPPPDFTNGVWEGIYFRIDDMQPTTGPYTVYLDDLKVKNFFGAGMDCLIDDFESYTPANYVVGDAGSPTGNGVADTTAAPTDVQVVPVGAPVFPGQIIVGPGADGTLETTAAGDDFVSAQHARFNYPSVAGTSIGLAPSPNLTAVSAEEAFSGSRSLKVQWAFLSASNLNSVLRLTSNGSIATNPPETFDNPDSVVRLSNGLGCESGNDVVYSFMLKFELPPIPGDCDADGRIDLFDVGCMQRCFMQSPLSAACATFDIDEDGDADLIDYSVFQQTINGP
jgi:hypothetical protein